MRPRQVVAGGRRGDSDVKLVPLLWTHRKALALSALAAVVVAVPFGLLAPSSYRSSTTVLLSAVEPSAGARSGESVLSLRLKDYAADGFADDVEAALGANAEAVSSVAAREQKTDPIAYQVTVAARSRRLATEAINVATRVLAGKHDALAKEAVDRIERQVNEELGPLTARKSELDAQVATRRTELEGLEAQVGSIDSRISTIRSAAVRSALSGASASAAAERLIAPLQAQRDELAPRAAAKRAELDQASALASQADADRAVLVDALSTARKNYVAGRALTTAAPAQAPKADTLARVAETAGLGLVLGLSMACLALVWLERRALREWLEPLVHDVRSFGATADTGVEPAQRDAAAGPAVAEPAVAAPPVAEAAVAAPPVAEPAVAEPAVAAPVLPRDPVVSGPSLPSAEPVASPASPPATEPVATEPEEPEPPAPRVAAPAMATILGDPEPAAPELMWTAEPEPSAFRGEPARVPDGHAPGEVREDDAER